MARAGACTSAYVTKRRCRRPSAPPRGPRLVAAGLALLDDGFLREDPVAMCEFLRKLLRKPGRTRQS